MDSNATSTKNNTSAILETLMRDLEDTQMFGNQTSTSPSSMQPTSFPNLIGGDKATDSGATVGEDISMKQQQQQQAQKHPRAPSKRPPIKRKRLNFDEENGSNAELQAQSSFSSSSSSGSTTSSTISTTRPGVGNFGELLESLLHVIKCLILFLR